MKRWHLGKISRTYRQEKTCTRRVWIVLISEDILHDLFGRFSHRPGTLSHLRCFQRHDEPEILPSSIRQICPIGADSGQIRGVLTSENRAV